MIKVQTSAKLLSAVSKPYSFNGNEGISYKIRFIAEDSIFEFRSNKEQVTQLESLVGKVGTLEIVINSVKETLVASVGSFVTK